MLEAYTNIRKPRRKKMNTKIIEVRVFQGGILVITAVITVITAVLKDDKIVIYKCFLNQVNPRNHQL